MEKVFEMLSPEVQKKYRAYPSYIKIFCMDCGKSWGIHLEPGETIPERKLVCQSCVTDKYFGSK